MDFLQESPILYTIQPPQVVSKGVLECQLGKYLVH